MNLNRSRRSVRPWYAILLAAVAAAVIIFGVTQLGSPASSAARTSTQDVSAENGVVQTTVSGSGEVEPGVDDTLNFGTSGTLKSVAVKVGQHVTKGQLIATLDPSSSELTLEEANASLTAAEDNLTEVEDGTSTGSASGGSSNSSGNSNSASTGASASAASVNASAASVASVRDPAVLTSYVKTPEDSGATGTGTTTTTSTTTTGTTTTPTTTTPSTTTSTAPSSSTSTTPTTTKTTTTRTTATTKKTPTSTKKTPTATNKPTGSSKSSSSTKKATTPVKTTVKRSGSSTSGASTTAAATATTKTAPTAAQIQQAEVQVAAAKATVAADQKSVSETKLYAPASGQIATLSSDSIGQTVSSGSSSSAAAAQSSASSSATGGTATTSSGSTGFATLVNDNTMTMTVSISEDDISSVKVGQTATVSITALSGVELAGRVSSISPIGTSSSGVVSYDATVSVAQSNSKVLPGMSATAAIVTGQAQGVTVANQAITGTGNNASVELVHNGKTVSTPVVVGLKGSSRSQIVSGLKAGDEVQVTITLPSLGTSTTSSSSSSTSGFGNRLGGAGGAGGAGGFTGGGAGGFRAFFGGGAG
jgi:multidrug efflux pump subunit AcrA (membrane-fusion protein)